MPPNPPFKDDGCDQYNLESLLHWEMEFEADHKKLGEKHQKHVCRPVCFKGRPAGSPCRFGFPHDLVEISSFDCETNSIIFARRSSDINGHSPVVLVCTRHNHDVKCILSGKAAKAAMFYISDYITKMPLKTDQLLSIL
ncbi:hypothetical protein BT96DRAFT_833422, partial [Gymnopus androsaceus JB14]